MEKGKELERNMKADIYPNVSAGRGKNTHLYASKHHITRLFQLNRKRRSHLEIKEGHKWKLVSMDSLEGSEDAGTAIPGEPPPSQEPTSEVLGTRGLSICSQ